MESILILVLWIAISVWSTIRVTALFHEEDGPEGLLQTFRNALGAIEFNKLLVKEQNEIILLLDLTDEDELPLYDVRTFFGELFNCIRCLSIWAAFPHALVIYLAIGYPIVFIPILTFAISAIVITIHEN